MIYYYKCDKTERAKVNQVSFQVFLKYYHVEQLNLLLREVIARVVVMQAYAKGWLGARRYRKVKEKRHRGAIIIQSGGVTLKSTKNIKQ